MTKVICTTTINPPTEAILKFAAMKDWTLVIAGDMKTPEQRRFAMEVDQSHYLSPLIQKKIDPKLSELIGWNCIQRRNFAFLFACKELKADLVATIDDDNIPMENWGEKVHVGKELECDTYRCDQAAFDPLSVTCHDELWHRGYPLECVKGRELRYSGRATMKCDVQADFWNGEADVDALCRLTHETSDCKFITQYLPYTSNKPSPFNSQNTFLSKEVMPHYFMFPGIGRMDDIASSYHVQAQGFRVMYGNATVVQKRNEHNLISDLMAEYWGIEHNLAIVKEVPTNKNAVLDRLPPRSLEAFKRYQTHFE
jgi:hypothetical protein